MSAHEFLVLLSIHLGVQLAPKGAWLNACFEWLQENGYLSRTGQVTDHGKDYIRSHGFEVPK